MQVLDVPLQGITYDDIQRMFEQVVTGSKTKPSLLYVDVSYLYTFDLSDIPFIQKFTYSMRQAQQGLKNPAMLEWHRFLERWHSGEYVTLYDKKIKPLAIERTFDRVVNEFMTKIAGAMAGFGDFAPMKWHAIGDGASAGSSASPNDTFLQNEIDRINVQEQVGGGGLSVDGSTFMVVGNHDRFVQSADVTEMGIFDRDIPGTASTIDDVMGDHSIFPAAVPHVSGQDSCGGTTIVYQCSS